MRGEIWKWGAWLKVGKRKCIFLGPNDPRMFSERYGYRKPIAKCGPWRLFVEKEVDDLVQPKTGLIAQLNKMAPLPSTPVSAEMEEFLAASFSGPGPKGIGIWVPGDLSDEEAHRYARERLADMAGTAKKKLRELDETDGED